MYLSGLLNLSNIQLIIYTFIIVHISGVSLTLYLHRYASHSAFKMHPALVHFFRFWLWLTSGVITKEWIAVHRKHHAFVDTKQDPHSPVAHGWSYILGYPKELGHTFYTSIIAGIIGTKRKGINENILNRYGYNAPEDWLERNIYSRYNNLGLLFYCL